jgi:hypothetical protein
MRFASAFAVLLVATTLAAQNFPDRPVAALVLFHNIEQIAALGSDGKDFLAVGFRYPAGMVAHRITAAGEVLDGTGIEITSADSGNTWLLGIFWGGHAYTVLWQTRTLLQAPGASSFDTYSARIDREGRLIDGPRLAFSGAIRHYGGTTNGSRIVLAGGRATVLDLQGNLLEIGGVVPGDAQIVEHYSLAWNGWGFMVSWESSLPGSSERYVNVAPLDADGKPLGTFRKITVAGGAPSIASDGNDYVVVYRNFATLPITDYSQHVSATGEFLDQHPFPGSLATERSMVWDGTSYVVAAAAFGQGLPLVLRLDRTGAPRDTAAISVSSVGTPGYAMLMLTATNGRQVLVAWQQGDGAAGFRSFAGFLGSDEKAGMVLPLGVTPTIQRSPQIASSARNFMVVWEESSTVYASRLSFAGEPLDGRGIRLSTKVGGSPRVVFDGQTYVVAWWSGQTGIVAAHLSPDGAVLENTEKPILASNGGDFDLTTDGSSAFIAATNTFGGRVMATRVHRDGTADAPIAVSPSGMETESPRVAWNGQRVLVAWRELIEVPTNSQWPVYRGNLFASRVSAALTLLDSQPLAVAISDTDDHASPLLASNGADFMITWTDRTGIRARSVKTDGALDSVAPSFANGYGSSLVWDGGRYVLAFNVRGQSFFSPLGRSPAAIAPSADMESGGVLAPFGKGGLIAAYQRQASEAPYGSVWRVFVKVVVPQARTRAIR